MSHPKHWAIPAEYSFPKPELTRATFHTGPWEASNRCKEGRFKSEASWVLVQERRPGARGEGGGTCALWLS